MSVQRRSNSSGWQAALLFVSATACGAWGESDGSFWDHGVQLEGDSTVTPGSTAVAAWSITETNVPAHVGSFRLALDIRFLEPADSLADVEFQLTASGSSSEWSTAVLPVVVPREGPARAESFAISFAPRSCNMTCVDRVELRLSSVSPQEEPPLQIGWSASLGLHGTQDGESLPGSAMIAVDLEGS